MAAGSKEMEIAIKIAGKVESSFNNALGQATKGLGSITKTIAGATAAAAAAVGAMGVAAVNVGREFEGAMSQVAATMLIDKSTEEGQKSFETLENAARECGASTAFSATEAAEALNYLALAGYDADKAATALPTVLKLAGAGAMDLAAASDMVTDSMSALGIEATEQNLTNFSDQLAKTASKSNTSVAQLGEAILTVGGTAKGLAGGTTELNTALGILADNGLKGAEGGTHLRNMILSLQNPTDDAASALKSMGVDVYDAEGNMRGLKEVFTDLNGAMDGMNQAQKDNIISTLFNKTDLTAANAMLSNCTDRFDELSEAVENSAGACEDMYAIQLDNLNGDIDILKSGLSDLGISVYEDLNGPLREMTQLATSMVGELSDAYKEGGMAGMVGAVGTCLSEVVDVIADYAPQVVEMGISLIENFVSGIADNSGKIAECAGEILTTFVNGLFTLVPQVILAGIDIITQFAQSLTQQIPQLINNGTQAIANFVSGIIQRLPTIISTALALVQTLVGSLGANAPMLISSAIQLIGSLILGIVSMLPTILQMGIQLILSLAQGIIANLPLLLQMAVQIITSLIMGLVQMLPMVIQGGIQLIISLIQGIIANLGNIVQAAVQIILALVTGLIGAIPQIIAAVPQLIAAIIDTIFTTDWLQVGIDIINGIIQGFISMGASLWDTIKSLFTGKEPPDLSSTGSETAQSYADGITGSAATASTAASTLSTDAFATMDFSTAATAGTETGAAFSTGLTDSMSSFTLDTSAMGLDTSSLTATMGTAGADSVSALTTGITDNSSTVTAAMTTLGTDTNAALDSSWSTAQSSTETAMNNLTTTVKNAATAAASAVKSAFENMTITIPKPKIPVISVAYDNITYGNGGSTSVPKFNVAWNALGGIFTKPTILGSAAGAQGVGEAGSEAILPLDTLWAQMRQIVGEIVSQNSGASIIDALVEKLRGIGTGGGGGGNQPQLAGAGGPNISYSPTYNLYGSATKQDAVEAEKTSQAEFNKMMKQWQKDNNRTKF